MYILGLNKDRLFNIDQFDMICIEKIKDNYLLLLEKPSAPNRVQIEVVNSPQYETIADLLQGITIAIKNDEKIFDITAYLKSKSEQ